MRRTVLLLTGMLLCVVALGSDSPKEYDDKTESVGLEGTWCGIAVEENGEKLTPAFQVKATFCSGTLTYYYEDRAVRGSYRIDSARKPIQLDWMHSDPDLMGVTFKFIYRIDGDTLRVAFLWDRRRLEVQRPHGFTGEGVYIAIFKRVK